MSLRPRDRRLAEAVHLLGELRIADSDLRHNRPSAGKPHPRVNNNAGLEYGAVGEHELALSWLTRRLKLAVRTGDPERLVGQLRGLRAASLTKLGRAGRAAERRAGSGRSRLTVAEGLGVRRARRPGVDALG